MRLTLRYPVIPIFVGLVITGTSYFVAEPAARGAVGGFPLPYVMFHSCCSPEWKTLSLVYDAPNLVADVVMWMAISLAVIATFTIRRFIIGAAAGAGITLLSLLLPPLSIIAPLPASVAFLKPMGFPFEYLTYYTTVISPSSPSGYIFYFPAGLADFVLWAGIAIGIIGIVRARLLGLRVPRSLGYQRIT
jgi:hypothetical protein